MKERRMKGRGEGGRWGHENRSKDETDCSHEIRY